MYVHAYVYYIFCFSYSVLPEMFWIKLINARLKYYEIGPWSSNLYSQGSVFQHQYIEPIVVLISVSR